MTNEELYAALTPEIVKAIEAEVATALQRRGFHAPVTLTAVKRKNGDVGLTLESLPFQTVPVLFKEITIGDFGTWVKADPELVGAVRVGINVDAFYTNFSGGSNGVSLFNFYCTFRPSDDRVFDVKIQDK